MAGHRASRALGSGVCASSFVLPTAIKAQAAVDVNSGFKPNNSRGCFALLNDTDQPIYVYLIDDLAAIAAGNAKPTVKLASGQYYEDPANYQGWIGLSTAPATPGGAITAPTTGSVNLTEWL